MKPTARQVIAFDADDTLWHNETIFRLTQDRFRALMANVAAPDLLDDTKRITTPFTGYRTAW